MDSLPQAKHIGCFSGVHLSCSNTFWKPSKHLLLETCFSAMILTGEKKKKTTEKVKFENKTILVLEFLRTEELNTTCSIFA